jgi:hypothetical protein
MNRKTAYKQLFENGRAYGSSMLVALVDELGTEFFAWDPESLRMEIHDRFGANLPSKNMDKIQALLLCLTTNQFFVSLEAFLHVCTALSHSGVDFDLFDSVDLEELAWGVAEVLTLDPPEGEDATKLFGQEIRQYIALMAEDEGVSKLPRPLSKLAGDLTEAKAGLGPDYLDAEMYQASQAEELALINEVEDAVKVHMRQMLDEINALPLRTGDVETWSKYSSRAPQWKATPQDDFLPGLS